MKRKFTKQPVIAAITPWGKMKEYAKQLQQGANLREDRAFRKWCGMWVLPRAIDAAEFHYANIGAVLEDDMEYNENWDEQDHYLSVQWDSGDVETYIINAWDEVDTVIEALKQCRTHDKFIEYVADKLFIYDPEDAEYGFADDEAYDY